MIIKCLTHVYSGLNNHLLRSLYNSKQTLLINYNISHYFHCQTNKVYGYLKYKSALPILTLEVDVVLPETELCPYLQVFF